MKEVYDQFIEAVNGMRKDQYASDVYIIYPLHSQTDDTIIFHDEALLPHWREVAVARKLCCMFRLCIWLYIHNVFQQTSFNFSLLIYRGSGNKLREAQI